MSKKEPLSLQRLCSLLCKTVFGLPQQAYWGRLSQGEKSGQWPGVESTPSPPSPSPPSPSPSPHPWATRPSRKANRCMNYLYSGSCYFCTWVQEFYNNITVHTVAITNEHYIYYISHNIFLTYVHIVESWNVHCIMKWQNPMKYSIFQKFSMCYWASNTCFGKVIWNFLSIVKNLLETRRWTYIARLTPLLLAFLLFCKEERWLKGERWLSRRRCA